MVGHVKDHCGGPRGAGSLLIRKRSSRKVDPPGSRIRDTSKYVRPANVGLRQALRGRTVPLGQTGSLVKRDEVGQHGAARQGFLLRHAGVWKQRVGGADVQAADGDHVPGRRVHPHDRRNRVTLRRLSGA